MRASFAIAVLSAVVFAAHAHAPATAAEPQMHGTASSRFTGSSTLHAFSGAAPQSTFLVEPSEAEAWTATVEVPVAGLDVSLSAFGLEAPRQFVIVVADTVHITTEVSLRRE